MNVAFYATITQIEKIGSEIYSIERIKYLNSISNNKRRTQSKCAWILLQQICEKYNLLVNDFYTKNGKCILRIAT